MPVAKDAYGFALHYYGQNDYKPIGGVRPFANADTGIVAFKPLYNGNIAAMAVNIPKVGEPLLYNYSYDQLNRITGMDAYRGLNVVSNTWTPISTTSFKERVSYDANGNILSYLRNGNNLIGKPLAMDSMTYHYIAGTNQLDYISDPVNKNNYKEDIDNQEIHNYVYDSIGNLIKDNAEKIQSIDWTVYGKISRILKKDTTEISYIYDAAGQRISKVVTKNNKSHKTIYVRDASGNVMSIYEADDTSRNGHLVRSEIDLYGSNRLGIYKHKRDMDSLREDENDTGFVRGEKEYELYDHRNNIMVTISDMKRPIKSPTDSTLIIGYEPVVLTATDYFPFGMQMPGRHGFATESGSWHGSYGYLLPDYVTVNFRNNNTPPEYTARIQVALDNGFNTGAGSDNYTVYISDSAMQATADSAYQLIANGYRYGFNGKEKDDEIKGEGNQIDYGMRIQDSRSGRFLSIDPLTNKYAELTPYQYASNRPIDGIDIDGLEYRSAADWAQKNIANYKIFWDDISQNKDAYKFSFKNLRKTNWKDVIASGMYCATSTSLSYAQGNQAVANYLEKHGFETNRIGDYKGQFVSFATKRWKGSDHYLIKPGDFKTAERGDLLFLQNPNSTKQNDGHVSILASNTRDKGDGKFTVNVYTTNATTSNDHTQNLYGEAIYLFQKDDKGYKLTSKFVKNMDTGKFEASTFVAHEDLYIQGYGRVNEDKIIKKSNLKKK